MQTVFGFHWKLTGSQDEFEELVPQLMNWLKIVRDGGNLCACGAWESGKDGLTLLTAANLTSARAIHEGNPLNAIGTVSEFAWEVYYADLHIDATFQLS